MSSIILEGFLDFRLNEGVETNDTGVYSTVRPSSFVYFIYLHLVCLSGFLSIHDTKKKNCITTTATAAAADDNVDGSLSSRVNNLNANLYDNNLKAIYKNRYYCI